MNPKAWEHWLSGWLQRHPVQEPPEQLRWNYTRQVMDRIHPQPVWVFRPRPVFGLAGALAAVLAVVVVVQTPSRAARQALELWNEVESLEEVPSNPEEPASDKEVQDLEKELRQMDESDLPIS